MLKIFLALLFLLISCSESKFPEQKNTKSWLFTCAINSCSPFLNLCFNCFGERQCKTCITNIKSDCELCANDIYDKNNLEYIGGKEYLICDSTEPLHTKVCHLFCRGQFSQTGFCSKVQNVPVCICSSDTS